MQLEETSDHRVLLCKEMGIFRLRVGPLLSIISCWAQRIESEGL